MFLPGIIGEAKKVPRKDRSRLAWDREKCTLCGGCVPVCDPDAIAVFETFLEIDSSRCRLCGDCVRGCPTGALAIEGVGGRVQGSGTHSGCRVQGTGDEARRDRRNDGTGSGRR